MSRNFVVQPAAVRKTQLDSVGQPLSALASVSLNFTCARQNFELPLREIDLSHQPLADAEREAQRLYSHDACYAQFDPFKAKKRPSFSAWCTACCRFLCTVSVLTAVLLCPTAASDPSCAGYGPLSHFHLVKVAEHRHFFFYGMHHAIFDGYSDTVFWRELNACYLALSKTEKPVSRCCCPFVS